MNLAEISIRRPVFTWMLMGGIFIVGWLGFQHLGISQLPDVDFPNVSISVDYPGAAPELVESEVLDPIESTVMSIDGIRHLSSSAKSGRGSVSIEFELSKDINTAVQEIQTLLGRLSRRLPKDADPPVVSKMNPEDQPILWLRVTSENWTPPQLMAYVDSVLKVQFSTLEGVAEVFLGGYVDPQMRVWVSSSRLNRSALTVSDVISAIQSEHSELPAGIIENDQSETLVRSLGEAKSQRDFEQIAIQRRGGAINFAPLSLGDVATVEDSTDDIRRMSRSMGKPAIGIGIKKQRGSNAVAVGRGIKAKLLQIKSTVPPGVELAISYDSTKYIEESVGELIQTLVMAAILTAFVCWIFLGSWSATLNIILAIPISIVGTFFFLDLFGFTLNSFTLLALTLAVGIVVDDAIMVLENITRHHEDGLSREQASLVGAREITGAAVAASLAIVAIFLPIAFLKGMIGKYLMQFGVCLSLAVMISLVEALSFTPMRSAQFMQIHSANSRLNRWWEKIWKSLLPFYQHTLQQSLAHPYRTLGLASLVFALSMGSLFFIKKEFVPAQDQGFLMIRAQTAVGSSLTFTDKKFKEIEKIFMELPEMESYYASIGGFGGGDVNTGVVFLNLKPLKERPVNPTAKKRLSQIEIGQQLRKSLASVDGIKVFIQDTSVSGFGGKRGYPLEFQIDGPDWNELTKLSQLFIAHMEKSQTFQDPNSNYQAGMPELHIIPDREKARQRGVSVSEINQTVSALVGGANVARYSKGSRRYDVRVRLIASERNSLEGVKALKVRNNRGEIIPLRDVARFEQTTSMQAIYREERQRAVTLFSNISPTSTPILAYEEVEKLGKQLLPEGYRLLATGNSETFKESSRDTFFVILMGVLVAYMILASQFNSFLHPVTVLLALPFSISGALLALWATGQSINMFSVIGIVLLMGIVKKNSILIVEFTNQLRDREKTRHALSALLESCPKRLRPILMTSVSTIAGAIPAALALGPGSEIRIPMAIAVIGGVLLSTVLTLYVVPCFYLITAKQSSTRP